MAGKKQRRRKRRNSNKLGFILGAVAVILAAACVGGFFFLRNWQQQSAVNVSTCYAGIFVDDIDIGGMTREDAKAVIEAAQQTKIQEHKVVASFEDLKWEFTMNDVNCTFDTDEVLNQAFNLGREGSMSERYAFVKNLEQNPQQFYTKMSVDASPLQHRVKEIADSLKVEPKDASILNFDPKLPEEERFSFEPEQIGRQANEAQLFADIKASFEEQTYAPVTIAVETVEPAIKLDSLKGKTQKISSFTTNMENNSPRETNIELACNAVSGTILMPGEVFSFNEATGERSAARGYKVAGIISGGEPDEGLGGGVCQVSGTLFNSAVMANLTIVERTRHSYVLGYLPGGRDATVDYPRVDFKFRNDGDTPVYLVMYADREKNTVTAEVYGSPLPDGMTVELDAVTTAKTSPGDPQYLVDKELKSGQTRTVKARTGYSITVYKVYKNADGSEARREVLHKDKYPAMAKRIYVAKGELPTDPTPTPTPGATPGPGTDPTPTPDSVPTPTPADPVPTPPPEGGTE